MTNLVILGYSMPPGSNQPKNRGKVAAALKKLRSCCGMTQESFATLVGAKRVTIKKIEQGQRGIGPELANAISAATGIEGSALMIGELRSMANKPYTPDLFMSWKTMKISCDESQAAAVLFGRFCGDLIESAVADDEGIQTPHKFRVLMVTLGNQFRELVALVGEERLNEFLQGKKAEAEAEKTYRQWRAHFDSGSPDASPGLADLFSEFGAEKVWQVLTNADLGCQDQIPSDLAPNTRLRVRVSKCREWDTSNAALLSGPPGTPNLPLLHVWTMEVEGRKRRWVARLPVYERFGLKVV